MKNYEIVNLEATVMVEAKAGKVIKLQPTSRNNMANKAAVVKTAQVAQEIKEAAVGPKAKVQEFVIDGELNENNTPKKIKLNGGTFEKISSKGDVKFKEATSVAPVAEEKSVVEETPVEEPKEEVKPVMEDFDKLPQFDFSSLKFGEPTAEPEDEKEVEGKLSDFAVPGFEEKKEEPVAVEEPVEQEVVPEAEEKPVVETPVAEVAPVEEKKEEEPKTEDKKDSPDDLAAQLKNAIDKQIEKAKAEAEEKAKKDAEIEIEKAKAEAEKAREEAAKVQEELDKTNVDLKNALKDLEAAKQEVSDANRYKEAVAQVIGEIGTREEAPVKKMAA